MKKIERAFDLLSRFIGNQEQCDIFNDARSELEELRERLRGIEWIYGVSAIECPACGNREKEGHKTDCWIGRVLSE